jgi:DNA processing protein
MSVLTADKPAAPATAIRLSDAQRRDWLRLIRSDGVGPVTFRELVNHFGSATAALAALPDLGARSGRRIRICPTADAERELEATAAAGGQVMALGEPEYPPWLRAAEGAPPLIVVRGNHTVLARPIVSIVGSRNASVAGRKFAFMLARGVGETGFAVASGLAVGIDAAAHEGSLATGTIAVFAGGVDFIYPKENAALAEKILAEGAHLSEMPIGYEPRAQDFPRRNRIISGLAMGIVVVEAADRSGSLVTARRATDQGRLVFAVPGSPLDPRAAGTNRLIKDGATMVTSVDDILAEVRPMLGQVPAPAITLAETEPDEPRGVPPTDAAEADRARVEEALGKTPVTLDEIVRFTGLKPAVVHLVLLELDLAGRIERHPGQRVSLA